jgi:hypothetical protein
MGARAFEGLKLRNGLLRELGPVQVLGVRCGGQLLLGDESSTHWVFCHGGGLGMESEEVVRLLNRAGMPAQVRKVAPGFNKAWVPGRG